MHNIKWLPKGETDNFLDGFYSLDALKENHIRGARVNWVSHPGRASQTVENELHPVTKANSNI